MVYDAKEFLERLYRSVEGPPDMPALKPADLPAEWHLQWDERAAIMEADGGLPREQAEALALRDVLEQMRRYAESVAGAG
jgi:hypothetical protein